MSRWMMWAAVAVAGAASAQSSQGVIGRALADPARADQRADDQRRQAASVLAFSGVKPGDVVVDYLPGSGYWTRILTDVVEPKGHVYALWPAAGAKYAAKSLPALQARNLANVTAEVQATDLPTAPKPVDLFWTVQNYHDVANGGGAAALHAFDQAVYKLLKPGGTYVIIDHVGTPGSGLSATNTAHRIDPAAVKAEVTSVGFRFAGESRVLRNAKDDRTKNVFDPAVRGHTDQFVYKFTKPR